MRNIVLSVLFFFFSAFVLSQNFYVEVSEKKVGLNESFEISFILNDNGKNFNPPPFPDFQILRGPSKSSSTSIINGNLTKEMSYTYVLKPKKIGVFTIMPASIKVNKKTIGTNPVTIQVQKGTVSKTSNTPYNIVSRKVHLEVKSDKSKCYVGEPVVLTYTLYFNLNIGSVSPNSIEYSGFWVDDVEVNTETRKSAYKGENYNSAIIKQVVLIPQVSGKQNIDGFALDLVASVPTNKRDFFNMFTTQSVNYTVVSNDLNIDVLELPKNNMPANFSGAIGDFKLVVDLDKDSIDINESATFSVKISGKGNLSLINSPKVDFNSEIEVFEPKNRDRIKINQYGMQGYKKEEYLIVPRYKGEYNLNPVEFNYFNPKTKKYIKLISKNKKINVGGEQQKDDSYTLQSVSKEKIDLINEDIKFIKTNYNLYVFGNNFHNSIVFYFLLFTGLLLILLAFLYKREYVNLDVFFSKNILKQTHEKLKRTRVLLNQKKYQELQLELLNILFFYLSNRFSIKKIDLNEEHIEAVLIQSNVSETLIQEYLSIIKYIERSRYSPHELEKKNQELYDRVVDVINKIDVIK